MELHTKLFDYVSEFNKNDEEIHASDINNAQAPDFLWNEIPLIDLPDKTIERTYYFRWWTFRKHIRNTPLGYIITEFQPAVEWSGLYNSINCALPFHLREGRWLKNGRKYLRDYALFFLHEHGQAYRYSMNFVSSLWEYASVTGDYDFLCENYDLIRKWLDRRIELSKTKWGLFYSSDGKDGMEYGISGSGLRPTINSYIYADAAAISKIAQMTGKTEDAAFYKKFADDLAGKINTELYDGNFYRTIPESEAEAVLVGHKPVSEDHNCKELIGYIPWMFGLADEGKDGAWKYVLDEKCFYAPFGLTTADRSHPRFMEKFDHECLWNGPVWPFATSQVLIALKEARKTREKFCISSVQYCNLIHQYASAHKRTKKNGVTVDWIDEDMDPFTGEWIARSILEDWGFLDEKGGYERGKDYNHSVFCDLVLSGLLGISEGANKTLSVIPDIPDDWDYFRVENLHFHGKQYHIYFDKTGKKYGKGSGLIIEPLNEQI